MPVETISEPTADEQQVIVYRTKMRKRNNTTLDTGRKYALCLIALAPTVTQPDDYASIKSSLLAAVPEIEDIELMIDGVAPPSIPAGTVLRLDCIADLRIVPS